MESKMITLGKLRMNIRKINENYQRLLKQKEELEEKLSHNTFFLVSNEQDFEALGKKIIECSELIKQEKELRDLYYELLEIKNV